MSILALNFHKRNFCRYYAFSPLGKILALHRHRLPACRHKDHLPLSLHRFLLKQVVHSQANLCD